MIKGCVSSPHLYFSFRFRYKDNERRIKMEEKVIKMTKEVNLSETKERKSLNYYTWQWEIEYRYRSAVCPWCGKESELNPTGEKMSGCRHFRRVEGEKVVFSKEWQLLEFRRVAIPTVHTEYRLGERIIITIPLDDFKFADSLGYPRESLDGGEKYVWADEEARNEQGEIVPHHCSRCGKKLPAYHRSEPHGGIGTCECGGRAEPDDVEWYHHM
jgi:hypothetical protein